MKRTKRGRFAKARKRSKTATVLRHQRSCSVCRHPAGFHAKGGCKAFRGPRRCGCKRLGSHILNAYRHR